MKIGKNTIVKTVNDSKRELLDIEIGDSKQDDFFPQVKIKKWDNECNFSMRYKQKSPEKGTYREEGDKIIWKNKKEESHLYELENGFELEAILNERPKEDFVEFTIQTKGLSFFYQGELTEDEIAKNAHRPEHIVGSYAVYTSERKKNYDKGTLYRAGKVGHIYRPKIIDNNGDWVWGTLDIDTDAGILTVTAPSKFLDNAVYPVRVDPTFGYDYIGGSNRDLDEEDDAVAIMISTLFAVSGDICTGFSFYAKKDGGDETVGVSLYTVSGGVPVTKVGTGGSVNVNSTTAQWWNITGLSDALTGGTEYCVAYGGWGGPVGAGNTQVYYDNISGGVSYHDGTNLPSTWNELATGLNTFSLYATYTRAPIDFNYTYTIFIDKAKL